MRYIVQSFYSLSKEMLISKGSRKNIYLNDGSIHHKLPKPGIKKSFNAILYFSQYQPIIIIFFRQGPSHKKFSEYFNNTSNSSDSDSKTSNDEEDNKKKNISDSSDSDSLILPMKSSAKSNVQPHQILSESEPEDPEEVRIHQEKLKARRSRIITNMSTISVVGKQQDNLTFNMTSSNIKDTIKFTFLLLLAN